MSNDRFNIWYNRMLGRINEEADESLWNEIEDELDFRETWQNISGRLDKVEKTVTPAIKKKSYIKEIIGIAAGLLLVLATAKYITDRSQYISLSADNAALTMKYMDQRIESGIDEDFRQTGTGSMVAGLSDQRIYPENLPAERKSEWLTENEFEWLTEREIDHQISGEGRMAQRIAEGNNPAEKQSLTGYYLDSKRTEMSLAGHSSFMPVRGDMPGDSESGSRNNLIGFKDAGIVFGYKNTWLLNHETYNGLNPSKLNSALPTYRHEIGVVTTMIFMQGTAIGLEFFWRSEVGQKYQQYINASYMDRSLNLDYLKLQASWLWDPARVPGEFLLGGYFSLLKTGKETRGKDILNISQSYSDSDYGLLLGYQLNVNVHDRVILKPGIRFNYNLRNIFEGDYIIPSHLKKTHSFSGGFNISIAYKFF